MIMKNSFCITAAALAVMLMSPTVTHGQFFTVHTDNDNLSLSLDPFSFPKGKEKESSDNAKVAQNPKSATPAPEKQPLTRKEISSSVPRKPQNEAEIPPFDTNDSILFEIIKKRLNVCMPLDYMRMSSGYGYRFHPIKRCRKFHDGIDLATGKTLTFSMLPGRVETVRHGNTGYGNYVILDHGNLRCLYGHLSKTLVSEGQYVDAGTAIAVTGNTGAVVGKGHLHLRLQKWDGRSWVSVNPKVFTDYLNGYIAGLSREIRKYERGVFDDVQQDEELTIASLYRSLKRHNVKYPKIVLAQAILETGWFRSDACLYRHNLFGLTNPRTGELFAFDKWEDSVLAYINKVQYRYKGPDANPSAYYSFLDNCHYAGDKSYIYKVKQIADRL